MNGEAILRDPIAISLQRLLACDFPLSGERFGKGPRWICTRGSRDVRMGSFEEGDDGEAAERICEEERCFAACPSAHQ